MIYFYQIFVVLLTPVYLIILLWRLISQKEELSRIKERFGIASKLRPANDLIWLHAASVGESGAALTLVENLSKILPSMRFLITSGTKSSAMILKERMASNSIHQFLPLDHILFMRKFLKYWQPKLTIFVESELWPCAIYEASKNCPLLLFNARLSDKSFHRWKKLNSIFKTIISRFNEIIVQSTIDLEKFHALGIQKAKNLGNIKFANEKLKVDQHAFAELSNHLREKKIIVLASTHFEDEKQLLHIIAPLKKQYTNCYFILIPRHPERKLEISKTCNNLGLKFKVRSQEPNPDLDDDLYIVDSFGELGIFYSISDVTFIGGSFNHGGHNPLEAAHFNNLIILGPDMSKCQVIATQMIQQSAAIQIQDSQELLEKLKYFLSAQGMKESQMYRANSLEFVMQNQQILQDYLTVIQNYFPLHLHAETHLS